MADYIDREEILSIFNSQLKIMKNFENNNRCSIFEKNIEQLENVIEIIKSINSLNIVEVVRCKDCKHTTKSSAE